jgi:hypothetical protein
VLTLVTVVGTAEYVGVLKVELTVVVVGWHKVPVLHFFVGLGESP